MRDLFSRKTGFRSLLALLLILSFILPGCTNTAPDAQLQSNPSTIETTILTEPQTTVDILATATPQLRQEIENGVVRPTQPPQEDQEGSADPNETPPETNPSNPNAAQGRLEVHFIDVGQADATLLICNGKTMLIDGGNVADSSRIYTYLKNKGIGHLDYVIGTHAHEDHIGGIPGALNYATVGKVYCPVRSFSTSAFKNFVSAVEKRGATITVPTVGTSFSLGGATCTVLAVNTTSDTNETSIVLRVTYGSTSFLFMGDAEYNTEQAMINRGSAQHATVLKVGHHGSNSSSCYSFLWNVMPTYAVIHVGTGNTYGHPTTGVLSRLRDADVKTYRTDMQGDIVCVSNGSTVSFTVSRNANADTYKEIGGNSTQQPTEPETTQPGTEQPTTGNQETTHYILNKNSLKFHLATCEYAQGMSSYNRWDFYGTREEVIAMFYQPCSACNP